MQVLFEKFQVFDGFHRIFRLEHRIAGDQHVGTSLKQTFGILRVHAAVHLDEGVGVLFINH